MAKEIQVKTFRMEQDLCDWISTRADYFGVSENEFMTAMCRSLSKNYTDKELCKIVLGVKDTLTPRNIHHVDKRAAENFISKKKGLSTTLR